MPMQDHPALALAAARWMSSELAEPSCHPTAYLARHAEGYSPVGLKSAKGLRRYVGW